MKSLFYGSAALLALSACPALAQENAGDIIVTATGAPLARTQSGQAVSVLTARDIAERQTVSAADLIATLPGISMSRNGPLGGFAAVRIRGAQGEQTLALIDGVKVNDPSSPGGGFDFGALLTDTIDRIEVLRGPNSVPWSRRSQSLASLAPLRANMAMAMRAALLAVFRAGTAGSAPHLGAAGSRRMAFPPSKMAAKPMA